MKIACVMLLIGGSINIAGCSDVRKPADVSNIVQARATAESLGPREAATFRAGALESDSRWGATSRVDGVQAVGPGRYLVTCTIIVTSALEPRFVQRLPLQFELGAHAVPLIGGGGVFDWSVHKDLRGLSAPQVKAFLSFVAARHNPEFGPVDKVASAKDLAGAANVEAERRRQIGIGAAHGFAPADLLRVGASKADTNAPISWLIGWDARSGSWVLLEEAPGA